jgi:hypothetical protein
MRLILGALSGDRDCGAGNQVREPYHAHHASDGDLRDEDLDRDGG